MAAGDGLISMTPTSIAYSGTSAGINADGGVDFSAVTSLSLNGVFTGDYDNYLISVRTSIASGTNEIIRLRASGSDATGTNYVFQVLYADSTTKYAIRPATTTYWYVGNANPTVNQNGTTVHLYGPSLAQPTAMRSIQVSGYGSALLYDVAATHSLSNSYDGLTWDWGVNATGTIHVFGYEE